MRPFEELHQRGGLNDSSPPRVFITMYIRVTRRHRSSNAGTRLLSFIVFPPKDLIRLARAVPLE